jgi:hypothetical protein
MKDKDECYVAKDKILVAEIVGIRQCEQYKARVIN